MENASRKKVRLGCVRCGTIYTRDEFLRRTAMCKATLNSHRRKGLKITCLGKLQYVSGDAWFEYVRSQETTL